MAHNVNPRTYNEYLVRHGVPPGPGHWTAPACRCDRQAEGADKEIDFERWWGNAGPYLDDYVRRCEVLVRDKLLPGMRQQQQALAEGMRNADRGPDYELMVPRSVRRPIERALDAMVFDIGQLQLTGGESRLERMRAKSVVWTQEQWDRHPAEIAVYDRAEAGARLVGKIYRELRVYMWSACERELLARVARWARLLEAWLADAIM